MVCKHLSKVFWKEVEGYSFHSVTLRGYKFEKKEGCVYIGQRAVYHGPYKAITDEEGHLFPRNEPVEVCTDTAEKLSNLPYTGQFTIFSVNDGNTMHHTTAVPLRKKEFLVAKVNVRNKSDYSVG